jgi:hypothetical protein
MLLLCLAAIALVFLLPRLGVDVAGSGLLLTALMVGCCVLPMLMSMRGKDGGCCGKDAPGSPEPDGGGEKGKRAPSCH